MIEAQVAHFRDGLPWDMGMHQFQVLPRLGECIRVQSELVIVELVVSKIIHHSQLLGSTGEPWVLIHAVNPSD